jgi:hypothetical protein
VTFLDLHTSVVCCASAGSECTIAKWSKEQTWTLSLRTVDARYSSTPTTTNNHTNDLRSITVCPQWLRRDAAGGTRTNGGYCCLPPLPPIAHVNDNSGVQIEEMYSVPESFLEIEVRNPQTHGTLVSFHKPCPGGVSTCVRTDEIQQNLDEKCTPITKSCAAYVPHPHSPALLLND